MVIQRSQITVSYDENIKKSNTFTRKTKIFRERELLYDSPSHCHTLFKINSSNLVTYYTSRTYFALNNTDVTINYYL